MWESRGLCGISKTRWKPFFGFHGDGISIAVGSAGRDPGMLDLGPSAIVAPGARDAVGVEPARAEGLMVAGSRTSRRAGRHATPA
jgi:hypothetical protein